MNIDVVYVFLNVQNEVLSRLRSRLTSEEIASVERYRFEDDRRRAIISRGVLREILPRYVSGKIEIVADNWGKPHLVGRGIEFNISHSGGLVVLAFADFPIGIDVECVRPLGEDVRQIAVRHFSVEELDRLGASSSSIDTFFAIWTAKEAVVKGAGAGLGGLPLRSFTVPFPAETFEVVRGYELWSVRALAVPVRGYRGSIAAPTGTVGNIRSTMYD